MSANPPADTFLLFRDGAGRERRFVFEPGTDSATVGRRTSSDLVLDWDDQVSRLHARFEHAGDAWELVDDGLSSNGSFVNEERLDGRRRLADGDILRFGSTKVSFHSAARARQPAPAAAPSAPAAAPSAPPAAPSAPPAAPSIELSSTQRRVLAALSRPYKGAGGFASPATDEQIADELVVSVGEVRTHLKVLGAKLGVGPITDYETRVRLVERAFSAGLISEGDR